jgi:methylated-DNA-[protein]-cysteine S-methyltransferase
MNQRARLSETRPFEASSSIKTELGYMRALCSSRGVAQLVWQQQPFSAADDQESDVSRETITQLSDYLAGHLTKFTIPLDFSSRSSCAKRWLEVMKNIPYGQTISYADYAALWGNRKASRAAGFACQQNLLPIILPCHRIVRSSGGYDNYSGGDATSPRNPNNIKRKQWLINLEAQNS